MPPMTRAPPKPIMARPIPEAEPESSTSNSPMPSPTRPPRVAAEVRRRRSGDVDRRPKPRASMEAAKATERSSAPSRTGTARPRNPRRSPVVARPRRRRASRTWATESTTCGVNEIATVTATATS